jgi:hypothetical protein
MQSGANNQRKRKVASTPKSVPLISQNGASKAGGGRHLIKKSVGAAGSILNQRKAADSGTDSTKSKTL